MNNYFLYFLFISGTIFSQNVSTLKRQAISEAKTVAQASITKDYESIIKHTHPNILKKYGEQKLRNGIKEVFDTMEAQNISILRSDIDGISELKKENREFRCLVKNRIQMDFNGRLITIKSSLFGFYDKKKEQWYFVESNKLLSDPETQKLFKNFKTEIVIPQDQQVAEN